MLLVTTGELTWEEPHTALLVTPIASEALKADPGSTTLESGLEGQRKPTNQLLAAQYRDIILCLASLVLRIGLAIWSFVLRPAPGGMKPFSAQKTPISHLPDSIVVFIPQAHSIPSASQ